MKDVRRVLDATYTSSNFIHCKDWVSISKITILVSRTVAKYLPLGYDSILNSQYSIPVK